MSFKTPISALQELVVQKKLPVPDYEYEVTSNDNGVSILNNNSPKFSCTVRVGNQTAVGEGSTKKEAKQNSAKKLLEVLELFLSDVVDPLEALQIPTPNSIPTMPCKTSISILQELMVQKKLPMPDYQYGEASDDGVIQNDNNNLPGFSCTVRAANQTAVGRGFTKKEAKQNSAKKLLELHYSEVVEPVPLPEDYDSETVTKRLQANNMGPFVNYVGKLNELASTRRHPSPVYNDFMMVDGKFMVECHFVNEQAKGYGSNKKEAKQESARNMISKLKDVLDTPGSYDFLMETVEEDTNFDEIIKKYSELTTNVNFLPTNNNPINDDTICKDRYTHRPRIETFEELKEELHIMGLTFTTEIFQRNPYIICMIFKHDTRMVVMGSGEDRKEAVESMVKNAATLMENGFYFQHNAGALNAGLNLSTYLSTFREKCFSGTPPAKSTIESLASAKLKEV